MMSALATQTWWLSLQVALLTLALSAPLAVCLASWMARTQWRGKLLLDTLVLLPLGLSPAVVGGLILLSLDERRAGPAAWLHASGVFPVGLVLVVAWMTVPLMVRLLRPAFEATDPMLVSVARTLGASPWQAWRSVSLPQVWAAIASAMALGLAAAWGESAATLLLMAALRPNAVGAVSGPRELVAALQQARLDQDAAWTLIALSLAVAAAAILLSEWGRRHWLRRAPARTTLASAGPA